MGIFGLCPLGRNAQGNLLTLGPGGKGAVLLGRGQPGEDVAKGDGVGPDAELRAPLLGDGLGEAGDAGLGQGVVELAGVAVDARGGGDVDDGAGLAVADAEVGGGGADEVEGGGAVEGDDGVPLGVGHLVDDAVPGVARVVDDDVDLAVAEGGRLLDELGDVLLGGDVAGYGDGLAAGGVDAVGYILGLFYERGGLVLARVSWRGGFVYEV